MIRYLARYLFERSPIEIREIVRFLFGFALGLAVVNTAAGAYRVAGLFW